MPLRNSGLALAAYDRAVREDQTFSFTVEAAPLKLHAPATTFEKQSARTSQTLQASLPVAPPPPPPPPGCGAGLVFAYHTETGTRHRIATLSAYLPPVAS